MLYIGIDPGLTGAVAAIDNEYGVVMFWDTPIIEMTKTKKKTVVDVISGKAAGKKIKRDFLPAQMAQILAQFSPPCHVWIEKVGAMPGQGVTSMFGFGKGFGMWLGIIAALKIPYTEVPPQTWKKVIMSGIHDKDAYRLQAQRLFPQCTKDLSRKMDNGRADALLIAEYGRRVSPSAG